MSGPSRRRAAMLLSLAALALPAVAAAADVGAEAARSLPPWWFLAPAASVVALVAAFLLYKSIMRESDGTDLMREIAGHVREGAYAYLRRQYVVVAIFFLVVGLALAVMAFGLHVQHALVPFAFITGGFFSGLAGFFGMKTATSSSARTAQAASESLDKGLRVAFRAGAVMGMVVVGLALLDITAWFLYLYLFHHQVFGGEPMSLETITVVMLCFGMGASSQALFARVGGGIYTKAADVGADLVGKVEAGIPEDDPRNPATIADNVGDNVGDVAGMGADLYESYAGSILASAALGVAAASAGIGAFSEHDAFNFLAAPMMLAAAGIILSILGILLVRTREGATMGQLLWALNRGIYVSSALIVVAAWGVVSFLGLPGSIFWAIIVGILLGLAIGKGTEWATAAEYGPTKAIANSAQTGPATLIIAGIAQGMFSAWVPILAVCIGMLASFTVCDGFDNLLLGLYGVAMAAVGMLSTLGITLATDAYGPIADNAGGIAEMAEMPRHVRQRTDALDSLGNTTAAIGKGFAIGSAALTALALLASYVEEIRVGVHREAAAAYVAPAPGDAYHVHDLGHGKFGLYIPESGKQGAQDIYYTISALALDGDHSVPVIVDSGPRAGEEVQVVVNQVGARAGELQLVDAEGGALQPRKAGLEDYMTFYNATLMNPKVLVGLFLGVLMVFVFAAMTMLAVGRAAMAMVAEVRRQFRERPGIMAGTEKPDYARCVAISTAGAQREMVLPSVMALCAPIAVGLVLDVAGVLGLLAGVLTGGFAMAVFMSNSGGAWDNAKKFIEAGDLGGKGSEPHKAAVVGDTVGDPFKDTSGPSLNILIKLTSMVSIVFAGLIVKFAPVIGAAIGMGN